MCNKCYYLCLNQYDKLLFVVINVNVDVEMHKVKIISLFYVFLLSFVERKGRSFIRLHAVHVCTTLHKKLKLKNNIL